MTIKIVVQATRKQDSSWDLEYREVTPKEKAAEMLANMITRAVEEFGQDFMFTDPEITLDEVLKIHMAALDFEQEIHELLGVEIELYLPTPEELNDNAN